LQLFLLCWLHARFGSGASPSFASSLYFGNLPHSDHRFLVDDASWVRDLVTNLTNRHEQDTHSEQGAWKVSDAPNDYVQSMVASIVGIEVRLTGPLVGKWKFSQVRAHYYSIISSRAQFIAIVLESKR
jgi:hypothetical protein